MALIKCTECNNKFSEHANACPNCGCTTKIVKKNTEIKKEKLYNKAIDIISNYKNIKELKKAKEIIKSLNGFKDSINKIDEIDNLLDKLYAIRKKKTIKIMIFADMVIISSILVMNIDTILFKKEIYKLEKYLKLDGYSEQSFPKLKRISENFNDSSLHQNDEYEGYKKYYYKKQLSGDKDANNNIYFVKSHAIFVYEIPTLKDDESECSYDNKFEYDIVENKAEFYCERKYGNSARYIYFEKDYNNNKNNKNCYYKMLTHNEKYVYINGKKYYDYDYYGKYKIDCEELHLNNIELKMDNFKNNVSDYLEKANVDINNIRKKA